MPPAIIIDDTLSSCGSSPLSWNPTPVPAPAFELSPVREEHVSWEYCTRMIDNCSRSGRSTRMSTKSFRDFDATRSSEKNKSLERSEIDLESSKDFDKSSHYVPDTPPQKKNRRESLFKKISGKVFQEVQCLGGKAAARSRSPSPPLRMNPIEVTGRLSSVDLAAARLSSVDLTGDADPRISSANANVYLDENQGYCSMEARDLGMGSIRRYVQHQEWMAMAARAEQNLSELAGMLRYTMDSVDDMKSLDNKAYQVQQRCTSRYYAS